MARATACCRSCRLLPIDDASRRACGATPAGPSARVRRLTPEEREALQGFPRGRAAIDRRGKPAADGPQRRATGNSMAVPVMRWVLTRLEAAHAAPAEGEAA